MTGYEIHGETGPVWVPDDANRMWTDYWDNVRIACAQSYIFGTPCRVVCSPPTPGDPRWTYEVVRTLERTPWEPPGSVTVCTHLPGA